MIKQILATLVCTVLLCACSLQPVKYSAYIDSVRVQGMTTIPFQHPDTGVVDAKLNISAGTMHIQNAHRGRLKRERQDSFWQSLKKSFADDFAEAFYPDWFTHTRKDVEVSGNYLRFDLKTADATLASRCQFRNIEEVSYIDPSMGDKYRRVDDGVGYWRCHIGNDNDWQWSLPYRGVAITETPLTLAGKHYTLQADYRRLRRSSDGREAIEPALPNARLQMLYVLADGKTIAAVNMSEQHGALMIASDLPAQDHAAINAFALAAWSSHQVFGTLLHVG